MNQYTRVTLIEKLKQQGNERCWQEFFDIYKPYVFVVISSTGVNSGDAEDLTQQVLLTCWEKLQYFDYDPEKGRFRSWLRRIVRNKLGNFFSRNSRRSELMDKYGQDLILEQESEDRIEQEWQQHLGKLAWKEVETRFSEGVKQAFVLSMQGKPPVFIAKELGIAENTAQVYKLRVAKALAAEVRKLREQLE